MLHTLRPRLTYANVMATTAVFVALGGTGYAAIKLPRNSVTAKQIAPRAVQSSEAHNLTLGDFKLGERAKLKGEKGDTGERGATGPTGQTGATGAPGEADVTVRKIDYRQPVAASATTVLELGGLRLKAGCNTTGPNQGPGLLAETTVDNADILAHTIVVESPTDNEERNAAFDDDFDVGEQATLLATPDRTFQVGHIVYTTPAGSVVTVQYQADDNSAGFACLITGHAFQS